MKKKEKKKNKTRLKQNLASGNECIIEVGREKVLIKFEWTFDKLRQQLN